MGRYWIHYVQFMILQAVYAFMGEREKAYENLRLWANKDIMPIMVATLYKK